MKLRHFFSVVIGVHLSVAALLFVTPGCQSSQSTGPSGPVGGSQRYNAADTVTRSRTTSDEWNTGPVYTPEATPSSSGNLFSPTRPQWSVNDNNTAAAVPSTYNDESVEVLQPVRPAGGEGGVALGTLVAVESGEYSIQGNGATSSYTVKSGDNLTKIARQHGISVSELLAANGMSREAGNKIRPGQTLTVPARSGSGSSITAPSVGSAPAPALSGENYTVRSGDTLSGIAVRHGTSVSALRSANGLSGDHITVGQHLKLPSGASASASGAGDSAASGRSSTGSGAPSASGPSQAATSVSGDRYTVRSGDTLGGIAGRHGTTVQAIMKANNITDPHRLRLGQTLTIPGGSSSSSASSESSSTPAQPRQSDSSAVPTLPPVVTPAPSVPAVDAPAPSASRGSGDDLLDMDNIPTVPANQ